MLAKIIVIQVHCCGLLFDKEALSGNFVVTGVVRSSEAAKVQFPLGSILAKVNGIPTQGKSISDVRKLLFSVGSDSLMIGAIPPGWPSIIDVTLSRSSHFISDQGHSDEFDNYCDGWSEKAFDEEHCCAKALQWVEANPPHLAEHRHEHDQIPASDELTEAMIETFYGDDFFQSRKAEATGRMTEAGQVAAWLQAHVPPVAIWRARLSHLRAAASFRVHAAALSALR